MEVVWFWLLVLVAIVYGVLDGYDIGVGIIYPFVGRTPEERNTARGTILPVWDGNEVWLIAGGGMLFLAFPVAYSAVFAGFYLAFFVLLWLLIPRGLAIELRGHAQDPLWRGVCDGFFFGASLLLGLVYGVALGNVLRGVPLDKQGYFFVPFWTNLGFRESVGVFDWYTLAVGVASVSILVVHGGAFLAIRCEEGSPVRKRALAAMRWGSIPALLLTVLAVIMTPAANRQLLDNYQGYGWTYLVPAAAGLSLLAMVWSAWLRGARATFVASSTTILLLVASAAVALFPSLVIARSDRSLDLTIYNGRATHHALTVGFIWALIGLLLAASYSMFVHRLFGPHRKPVT